MSVLKCNTNFFYLQKIECQGRMETYILPAKLFRKSRSLTRMNSDRIRYATVFPRTWKHLWNIGYDKQGPRALPDSMQLPIERFIRLVASRRSHMSVYVCSTVSKDVTRVNANCENIFCKCHARENRISFGSRLLKTLSKFNLNV